MEIEDYWERYRTHTEIQKNGAVTNLGDGIAITTHGIDTRLIAWPGNGFQTEAVHVLTLDLLINSGYYKDGKFTRPEFAQLTVD